MHAAAILNHKSAFRWLLCSVIILHTVAVVSGQLQSLLRDCCARGAEWGIQDPSRPENGCYNAPGPGRTYGISQEHLPSCLSMAFICCLKHRRNDMCELGKEKALIGDRCLPGNAEGGEYSKDCCEACKLGLIYGNLDSTCRLMDTVDIGFPWGNAFLDCCAKASVNGQNPVSTLAPPTSGGGIDHCLQYSGGQPCAHTCVNTQDGYRCECHEGYRLNPADKRSCLPGEDTCSTANPCEQLCTDTGTNVECDCYPGYMLANDLVHCEDTDECHAGIDDCEPDLERCINRPGSYICQSRDGTSRQPNTIPNGPHTNVNRTTVCTPGYEYVSRTGTCNDVDECQRNNHTCGTRLCHNTIGSYTCLPRQDTTQCPPGYKFSDQSNFCVDVDECLDGLDICNHAREFCLNIQGSYECQLKTLTTCPAGYKYNTVAEICEDIDECFEKLDDCEKTIENCQNTAGGYDCREKQRTQCPAGYKPTSGQGYCEDVNECQERLHQCDIETEICINEVGKYRCEPKEIPPEPSVACSQGTRWNDDYGQCTDVNECEENSHNCNAATEFCINTAGGFTCREIKCPPGFRANATARTCQDIDECLHGTHTCVQGLEECVNTAGGFTCTPQCPAGHQLNPSSRKCEDVDECLHGTHTCSSGLEECINTVGSFTCRTIEVTPQCPAGHRHNPTSNKCEDIDECVEEVHTCNRQREICVNSVGTFRCFAVRCPHGYRPNITSQFCEDIDECSENRHDCSPHEECINTHGGYSCKTASSTPTCPSGHRYNPSSQMCQDIDECSEGIHQCYLQSQTCENTVGNYTCQQICPAGYSYHSTQRTCQDIDECSQNLHDCPPRAQCFNTQGSYLCKSPAPIFTCPSGHRYNPSRQQCQDIDECSEGLNRCDPRLQICINTVGNYTCQQRCPTGYSYHATERTCKDVDECSEGSHVCDPLRHSCLNTAGTYRCVPLNATRIEDCASGFRFDSASRSCMDVNECQVGLHNCLSTQRCDNTLGSFSCIRLTGCGTGYTLNAHTNKCEDDNECELGNHNCGPTYNCQNSEGSFRCVRKSCPRGRLEPDGRCVPVTCQTGMEPNLEGQCIDINECNAGNVCRQNQRCINTEGSYQCQNLLSCGAGYEINESGNQCLDVDECRKPTHDCKQDQVCTNIPGGYTCQCRGGYTFNSQRNCEDIDECSRYAGRVCSSNAECQNTLGSYICRCKPGFKQSEDENCADIDECKEITGLCQHGCVNTWGSYQCTCKSGFKLNTDGRSCEDIDECVAWQGQGKLCLGNCVNQPGSYTCACPHGYKLSTDQRTCQDIDECSQGICSAEHEVCLNTRGSYKCNRVICPQNYIRDKDHKNRCKHQSPSCKPGDKACLEQPLAYSFNYITFVSNLPIGPGGQVSLFTMRGPQWSSTVVDFELVLKSSRSASNRDSATREDFVLQRTNYNQAVVSLVRSLKGPQELELELTMRLHHNNVFGGVAVAKIIIFVSEHEY